MQNLLEMGIKKCPNNHQRDCGHPRKEEVWQKSEFYRICVFCRFDFNSFEYTYAPLTLDLDLVSE